MDGIMYFVEVCQHNAKNNAWNYKQTKAFSDLELAKKEFHNVMATYIGYGDLDHVGCLIWDCFGNKIVSEYWQKPVEPNPETV